jgi:hypothetical protein
VIKTSKIWQILGNALPALIQMSNELLAAIGSDDLPTIVNALVQWLISERGASVGVNTSGYRVLGLAQGTHADVHMRLPLLPHRGDEGSSDWVWRLLNICVDDPSIDEAAVNAVLRVLVMRTFPCPVFARESLQRMHTQVVQEWARLQAGLAQRRALLDEHCLLIPPLRALIHGYNEPTTSEELWATGLGDA